MKGNNMSKRFAPLGEPKEGTRFANLSERLNAPLPGEPLYAEGDYLPPRGSSSSRLQAFRDKQASNAPMASTAPKATATVALSKPSAADLALAARTNAKYRHAKVMESGHVQGRERQAEAMLLASCTSGSRYAEAKTIIAELAKAPTDAQLAAVERHLKAKTTDAVWSRAYGNQKASNEPEKAPEPKPDPSKYDDLWQRAHAKPKIAPGNPA